MNRTLRRTIVDRFSKLLSSTAGFIKLLVTKSEKNSYHERQILITRIYSKLRWKFLVCSALLLKVHQNAEEQGTKNQRHEKEDHYSRILYGSLIDKLNEIRRLLPNFWDDKRYSNRMIHEKVRYCLFWP